MSGPFNYLLLAAAAIAAVTALLFWRKASVRTFTGSVPPDQSYPFSADAVLATKAGPKYTVFEFHVDSGNNSEVKLTSFTLSSVDSQAALAGEFASASPRADSSAFYYTNTSPTITIDFTKRPEGNLVLTKGNPATITVLSLPSDFSGLSITVTGEPIGRKTLKLAYADGTPITFEAMKRNRIMGLSLPDE